MSNVKENWEEIMTAPIPKQDMEWIIKTKSENKKGVKALMVTHTTRQLGIARLNEAFGLAWSDKYKDKNMTHQQEYGDGGFGLVHYTECKIIVNSPDLKTKRRGRGSSADIEPEKSAESNAFKRAVQKFGFGLELYNYPKVYVECTGTGAGTKNKYPPSKPVRQAALNYIHDQANAGTALDEYFIDAKGKLYSFAYGWGDKPVNITPVKKAPVKKAPAVEAPKMGTFPPFSEKPNSSWAKAIGKWDGNIHKSKDGKYNFVVLEAFGKKSYERLTPANLEALKGHSKHKAISK